MRKFLFGAAISMMVCGVAYAEDFIVVGSTDPRIPKSTVYSAGQKIDLPRGATVTLINGAGTLTTIQGRPGGVVLPASARPADRTDHFAAIRALLERPQARRTFGAMRGGRYGDEACPKVSDLTTIEAILAADENDCTAVAQEAMAKLAGGAGEPVAAKD
ncbi:MAG: hypothetical protein NW200_03625 [Hyphomonadaceae bacterium]|nr:hypothetical protein [Hyphomonadaceae bacterium]